MCALQKVISVLGVDVGYFHAHIKGVDFVFVDHPSYQRVGGLYADAFGVYGDNQASAVFRPQAQPFLASAALLWVAGKSLSLFHSI